MNSGQLVYLMLPPITAIALCDNRPISSLYSVIRGYLNPTTPLKVEQCNNV